MNTANIDSRAPRRVSLKHAILKHVKVHKLKTAMWLLRVTIILLGVAAFMLGIVDSQDCLNKIFAVNIAVCVLRLIQRRNDNTLTDDFTSNPFGEDSMQYVLYSWIFYGITPGVMFVAVIPVLLYAVLHVASYAREVVKGAQCGDRFGICKILFYLEWQTERLFFIVAILEVFLMFAVVFMSLCGMTSLLVPFAYSYFLTSRYYSRRNPYSHRVFATMRKIMGNVAADLRASFRR